MGLEAVLRELIGGGDDDNGTKRQPGSRANGKQKGTGKVLLEVIRLLVEMEPEEWTALLKLLKVLA